MIKDVEQAIAEKIAKHKQEIADLQKQLENERSKTEDQQLASALHGMLCTWNHTDGCGWFYEFKDKKDDWSGHAHGEYLKKAQKLMHICRERGISTDAAIDTYKLVKGL